MAVVFLGTNAVQSEANQRCDEFDEGAGGPWRPNSALSWQGKSHCKNIVPFSTVLCAGTEATFALKQPICSHHFPA